MAVYNSYFKSDMHQGTTFPAVSELTGVWAWVALITTMTYNVPEDYCLLLHIFKPVSLLVYKTSDPTFCCKDTINAEPTHCTFWFNANKWCVHLSSYYMKAHEMMWKLHGDHERFSGNEGKDVNIESFFTVNKKQYVRTYLNYVTMLLFICLQCYMIHS